ncbi:hypothetical protein CP970_15285 [Streptomyces kanamyceticus]|uniref:Uncharacterized protein n=1 Tax=Streptomyces kanamyceticus TaxID=1967 RepID=A0A5J6GC72_STRKN|nr:hypothetical protein CP970_15285 [Streptomyces kanamyceticus]
MTKEVLGKYLFREMEVRAGVKDLPLLSVSRYHGVVPRSNLTDALARAEDLGNYKVCAPGDIVVNRMSAYQGAMGQSSFSGLVSPDYMVLRPGPLVYGRYLHHLFRSSWFAGEVVLRLRGIGSVNLGNVRTPRINPDEFGAIPLPVPSLEEQRRIADFLDAETERVDALSQRFARLGELAVARARAVIDRAFSRFPHESTVPVSSVCRAIVDCVNKTARTSEASTQFKMIRTSNIRDGRVDLTDCFSVEREVFVEWNRRGVPRSGDVLLTREAPLGQAGMLLSEAPVFLGQRIMLYRADERHMRPELLLFNFLASHMDRQFRLLGAGALHEHMRVGDGLKLRVHCPPRPQQDALVGEIENGREQSMRLSRLADRQIALLAERRQALITAAVTGQFDVATASGRNVTDGVPTP